MRYIFGTVITGIAPAANNRGATESNSTTLQKIWMNGEEYTSVSSEAIRFAIRKTMYLNGVSCNRTYDDQDVYKLTDPKFEKPQKYADDVLFGFMDAKARNNQRGQLSVGRSISLFPFLNEVSFNCKAGKKEKASEGGLSLYEAQVHTTAYQYTFGVCLAALLDRKIVTPLLDAIADISPVGGNHARFFYDFSPESIVLRVTNCHSAGIQNCFRSVNDKNSLTDLVTKVEGGDIDPKELFIGGFITGSEDGAKLATLGVELFPGVKKAVAAALARIDKKK